MLSLAIKYIINTRRNARERFKMNASALFVANITNITITNITNVIRNVGDRNINKFAYSGLNKCRTETHIGKCISLIVSASFQDF